MPTPTAPYPSTTPPPLAPATLRAHPVLVVGGGPIGTLAASLLAQRGIDVVLVERAPETLPIDHARAYSIVLNSRTHNVLHGLPGLSKRVSAAARLARGMHMIALKADGKISEFKVPDPPGSTGDTHFMLRARIVQVFTDYMMEQPRVTAYHNTCVKGARFGADGSTTVKLDGPDGTPEEVTARFVLACDGKQSAVLQALRVDESGNVASSRGFADRSWPVYSTCMRIKTLRFKRDMLSTVGRAYDLPGGTLPATSVFVMSPAPGRSMKRSPPFLGFPVAEAEVAAHDGIIASTGGFANNAILNVTDVDALYDFVQENVPRLDARALIDEEEARRFVNAGPGWSIGPVRRCSSLAACVGADGEGGIVLLGEAAHSHPPELGQGLNSGVEGVGVLMHLIDEASDSASIGELVRKYERERDNDVDGLLYAHRYGARFQFGSKLDAGGIVWMIGFVSRLLLSKLVPGIHPPLLVLVSDGQRFGECMRKAKATTRRIWGGLIAAVALFVCARRDRKN